MIKLSVSIFGQITGYRIYTVSRQPIRIREIQYPMFGIFKTSKYSYLLLSRSSADSDPLPTTPLGSDVGTSGHQRSSVTWPLSFCVCGH